MKAFNRVVPMLVVAVALAGVPRSLFATPDADLRIVILEGEDGVNVIKKKTAVRPIVEVRDKNNLPVAGVAVVFLLPSRGPGASFANGSKQFSGMTDVSGRIASPSLKPMGKGAFQIQVRATYQGQTATSTISQTNFSTVAQATHAGKTPGSSAHASADSAGAQGSGGAAGAGGTVPAAAGSAAVGGGMSTGAIVGIVGGVAAASAGAGLAVTKHKEAEKNCDSLLNQAMTDLNTEATICGSRTSTFAQCKAAAQTVMDDIGRTCSCSSTVIPADVRSLLSQMAQYTGLTLPSACGF